MANLITLRWKLREGVAPSASDREDNLFDPVRIVKVEPSPSGPDNTDAEIVTRVLYNEQRPGVVAYHVTDTVAEILALANAALA